MTTRGVRFHNLKDVRRFMAKVINRLDKGEIDTDKARAFGYLCSTITTIIKDDDIETRLKTLEQQFENTNSK